MKTLMTLIIMYATHVSFAPLYADDLCGVAFRDSKFLLRAAQGGALADTHAVEVAHGLSLNAKNFQQAWCQSLDCPHGRGDSQVTDTMPAEQKTIDANMTEYHQSFLNSFTRINQATGAKEFFTPPVSGVVMPMREEAFYRLVNSTQPIMTALRGILQVFYAKGLATTAADLPALGLSLEEKTELLQALLSSVYFEPQMVDPRMQDYPFMPVARFDAVIADPSDPKPIFFEYNSGTPSGLSNLTQLIEAMMLRNPKSFVRHKNHLPEDHSFRLLGDAIKSSAKAWTGHDGLVVTLGPGSLNGAHPDIVLTAQLAGMPYVNIEDLYVDVEGHVRLITVDGDHPRVTGIYSRREESFVIQSNKANIPLRSPYFAANEQVGRNFGLNLVPHIGYKFFQDDHGNIVKVETDAQGQAVLQELRPSVSEDPTRPGTGPGVLADAIKSRKLFLSNLGGRVIDDKRLFELVARGLKRAFPQRAIAAPPRTLNGEEIQNFLLSPVPENFVVKAPDKSGGDGVYILAQLNKDEIDEVRRKVSDKPNDFIVQEFAPLVSTSVATHEGHQTFYQQRVTDWGLFVFQNAQGNVQSSARAILPRIAQSRSMSTNTSQGAGYGVALVLSDAPQNIEVKPLFLQIDMSFRLTISQENKLRHFFLLLSEALRSGNIEVETMVALRDAHRDIMEVIGRSFLPLGYSIEKFLAQSMTGQALFIAMKGWQEIFLNPDLVAGGLVHADVHRVAKEALQ